MPEVSSFRRQMSRAEDLRPCSTAVFLLLHYEQLVDQQTIRHAV